MDLQMFTLCNFFFSVFSCKDESLINPFVRKAPFLYPLKTENLTVF